MQNTKQSKIEKEMADLMIQFAIENPEIMSPLTIRARELQRLRSESDKTTDQASSCSCKTYVTDEADFVMLQLTDHHPACKLWLIHGVWSLTSKDRLLTNLEKLWQMKRERDNFQMDLDPVKLNKIRTQAKMFRDLITTGEDESGWFAFFTPEPVAENMPEWRSAGFDTEREALNDLINIATALIQADHRSFMQMVERAAGKESKLIPFLKILTRDQNAAWHTPLDNRDKGEPERMVPTVFGQDFCQKCGEPLYFESATCLRCGEDAQTYPECRETSSDPAKHLSSCELLKPNPNYCCICDRCNKKEYFAGSHASAFGDATRAGWLIENFKTCPDCKKELIANCAVCSKPIFHGDARVAQVVPAGSDNWRDLCGSCSSKKGEAA